MSEEVSEFDREHVLSSGEEIVNKEEEIDSLTQFDINSDVNHNNQEAGEEHDKEDRDDIVEEDGKIDDLVEDENEEIKEGGSELKEKDMVALKKELEELGDDEFEGKEEENIDDEDLGEENGEDDNNTVDNEDEATKKRRLFEEKFNALMKKPTKKRKNNDVDLEAMQDEAISHLKNMMKDAAYLDIDCVNNKKPATNKLKLLPMVKDTLLKSNLYDSILDNNLLEAVRIWLEPLPDASLPSFEIQKTLLNELPKLPIKTIHLRESGLGKIILFYQKSKKVDPALKRTAEKLIGDWTRPVMGRSDNYRAREIKVAKFDPENFNKRVKLDSNANEENGKKSLYQESADRRKRAAAPAPRTAAYTVAPQSIIRADMQNSGRDERFKNISRKLTKLGQKKKVKKDGVSIEGRGLNVNI